MSIELPRVLENGSYSRRLHPVSGPANLTLQPLSNVRLRLPKEDEISALDWVQIYMPDGGSGYYRVQSVAIDAVTGEQEAELEHGACTLEDSVIATDSKKTDTISNLLTFILNGQNRWTVGTVQATRTIFMNLGGSSPLDEISEMMGSIPDYQAVFVQNGENDWHIDILQRPSTAVCEARLSRNMESCSISYSVQEMVTRVYADGITNGHMDSANIAVYGLRERKQSLDKSLSKAQKEEIVSAYLANHDHPAVSIRISGVELSQITGLTLDQFQLGAVCRVALPWLGITQDQVITEKRYQDIYTAPEKVEITLANAVPDLSLSVAALSRGGARASNKARKEAITVDEIQSTMITTDDLEAGDIYIGSARIGTYLEVGWPEVGFTVNASGDTECETLTASDSLECTSLVINGNTVSNIATGASVSGNTLTITFLDGTTVNFSKTTYSNSASVSAFTKQMAEDYGSSDDLLYVKQSDGTYKRWRSLANSPVYTATALITSTSRYVYWP